MRIFLIRHGETEWNRIGRFQGISDIPLNETGKAQARALAETLKTETIDVFYSSPLIRAQETAEIIRSFHPSAQLFEKEGLKEMDLGDFEGMSAKAWAENHPEFRDRWFSNPGTIQLPGGESLMQVQNRVIHTVDEIIDSHRDDSTVLICSHNFAIHALLCHALGISLDRFREIKQDTAALNLLRKQSEQWIVEKVNDISHLQHLDPDLSGKES